MKIDQKPQNRRPCHELYNEYGTEICPAFRPIAETLTLNDLIAEVANAMECGLTVEEDNSLHLLIPCCHRDKILVARIVIPVDFLQVAFQILHHYLDYGLTDFIEFACFIKHSVGQRTAIRPTIEYFSHPRPAVFKGQIDHD